MKKKVFGNVRKSPKNEICDTFPENFKAPFKTILYFFQKKLKSDYFNDISNEGSLFDKVHKRCYKKL